MHCTYLLYSVCAVWVKTWSGSAVTCCGIICLNCSYPVGRKGASTKDAQLACKCTLINLFWSGQSRMVILWACDLQSGRNCLKCCNIYYLNITTLMHGFFNTGKKYWNEFALYMKKSHTFWNLFVNVENGRILNFTSGELISNFYNISNFFFPLQVRKVPFSNCKRIISNLFIFSTWRFHLLSRVMLAVPFRLMRYEFVFRFRV